jgi:hypothetical protein
LKKTNIAAACAFGLTAALIPSPPARAGAPDRDSTDPRAILEAAASPPGAERARTRMRMAIHDARGDRERTLTVRSLRAPDATKALALLEDPAELRGTAFLSIDYADAGRPDEQWLYLPRLHRTTRVPDSGRADAFAGSDFTYADLSREDPADYDLSIVDRAANVDGAECWQIEATPRSPKLEAKNGYARRQVWIAKDKLVPLQSKGWVSGSDRVKYLKATDVRLVNGVWTPFRVQMRTVRGGAVESETTVTVLAVDYGTADVTDADFTQGRLEKGP